MAEKPAAVTEAADWESIKSEYVTTNISQKELAEKYGVSRSTLKYRCAVERWAQPRREHRDRIMEKTSQRLSDAAAERMVQLMGGTDRMLEATLQALDDPEQFYRYPVKEKVDGEVIVREEILRKADTKAMKDVTLLLEKLTGLTRDLYGLPTREQELRRELAEERLALERQKLDNGFGEQQRIEVVFAAGEEEWNV